MLDLLKVYLVLIFLEESNDIRLRVLLDVSLVYSRLWVANVLNRFNLSNRVHALNFSQDYSFDCGPIFILLFVLEVGAEKVSVFGLVEKHRSSVKLVAQDSNSLEKVFIDVSKER